MVDFTHTLQGYFNGLVEDYSNSSAMYNVTSSLTGLAHTQKIPVLGNMIRRRKLFASIQEIVDIGLYWLHCM